MRGSGKSRLPGHLRCSFRASERRALGDQDRKSLALPLGPARRSTGGALRPSQMRNQAMDLSPLTRDEGQLGELAMKFRGTRSNAKRRTFAKEYTQTVERLI